MKDDITLYKIIPNIYFCDIYGKNSIIVLGYNTSVVKAIITSLMKITT